MTTEVILALVAIVATPLSAWLGSIFTRQKYMAEVKSLRADVAKKRADNQGVEPDNVRQGNEILLEQIVKPLKTEIKNLRHDVNKFRRAVEKIPACPHSTECPVNRELLADEADGDDAEPRKE